MASANVIAAVLTLTFSGLASTNSGTQIIPPYQLAFVNQSASFILNSSYAGRWLKYMESGGYAPPYDCSCVEMNPVNHNNNTFQLIFNSTTKYDAGRYVFAFFAWSETPLIATLYLLDVAVETNISDGGLAVWDYVNVTCTLLLYKGYTLPSNKEQAAFFALISITANDCEPKSIEFNSTTSSGNVTFYFILPASNQYHCTASFFDNGIINSTAVLKTRTVTSERYQLWDPVNNLKVNVSDQITVYVWDVLSCSGNAFPPANFTWEKQVNGNQWSVIQDRLVLNLTTVQNATFRCTAFNVIRGTVYRKLSDTFYYGLFTATSGKVTVLTENSTATPTQSTSFSTPVNVVSYSTSSSSFSSSLNAASDSAIAIGVGVGVGVGLPLVILVVVCVVCACRRQTCKSLDEKKPAGNESVDHPALEATDVSQFDNEFRRFDSAHLDPSVIIDNGSGNTGNTETHYENTRATVSKAGSPTNLYDTLDVTNKDRMASAVYTAIKPAVYANENNNLQFSFGYSNAAPVASADDVPLYDEINVAVYH